MELIRFEHLEDFRLFGYTLKQMKDMERFARGHGWRPKEEKDNG